jgi:hypothetical protein
MIPAGAAPSIIATAQGNPAPAQARPHPGRYILEQAVPSDDAALRNLVRSTPMDGPMRLSLEREPDFFRAAKIGNIATEVIVGREVDGGRVVSTASRAIRRAYVDGSEQSLGYLSSLRILKDAAGSTLLARGYRYLRELHDDARAPYYITTILEGNRAAENILTSERAGLPAYVPFGRLRTYLVPLYRRARRMARGSVARCAVSADVSPALECLTQFNAGLQFAPVYKPEDLGAGSHMLCGLSAGALYLHCRGETIDGTLAVWDQQRFKQAVVSGYSPWLAALRPFLAFGSHFGLAPRLPAAGHTLPCLYAALLSSRDSNQGVFEELFETVVAERSQAGFAYLLLGLSDRHPFCEVVERRAAMKIVSTIYLVYWRDRAPDRLPSRERIPHLEVATL